MKKGYNILYQSNYPWSDMYSRYICLALALSKNQLVKNLVFLNPLKRLGNFNKIIDMLKAIPKAGRYYKVSEQPFDIRSAISPIPLRRFKLFRILNQTWENAVFKQTQKIIPCYDRLFLLQGPSEYTLNMLKYLKRSGFYSIFDWGDLYEKHSGTLSQQKKTAQLCREIAKNADVVLGVSDIITNIALSVNRKSFTLRDAVQSNMILEKPVFIRNKNERLRRPRIGYFGLINQFKLEYSLIKNIVELKPDWDFIFIGPRQDDILLDILKNNRNVYFIKPMDGKKLMKYLLDNVDLVFAIYNPNNEATKACSPMKLYETLAIGLPFVTTKSFDPGDAIELIRTESSVSELIDSMEKELLEDSFKKRSERLEYARKNTWELRAEELIDIVEIERSVKY